MYYVYILYSSKLDSFYKGQTANLKDRMGRHNNKQEKSTKAGAPWVLLWATTKNTRAESMGLELKLKYLNRQRLLAFMLKYEEDIAGHDEALQIQCLS